MENKLNTYHKPHKKYYHTLFSTKNLLILLLFLPFFIYSCKDDPVTPTEDFAPSRFNWRTVDINQNQNPGFADIWAMDTNNIYLLNHYDKSFYIVSHGFVTTHYIGNYFLTQMKGISNSEIYIFAAGNASNLLTIIKWNGGGFEYYPTDIIIKTGASALTIRGCVVSYNEIWALSMDGICRFDGSKITNYSFGDPNAPLLVPLDIFLSNNQRVQYIAYNQDTANQQNRLYEFADTGFVKIYEGTNNPFGRTLLMLKEVGGVKFGLQLNQPLGELYSVCIKYFTGSSFSDYFCYNDLIGSIHSTGVSQNPVGSNLQSFIFFAEANKPLFTVFDSIGSRVGILHWDGNKVSKETGLFDVNTSYDFEHHVLFAINQENYLILNPFKYYNTAISLLYIGTKK
jgi:hypothetical protein